MVCIFYWFDAVLGILDSGNFNRNLWLRFGIGKQILVPGLADCFSLTDRGKLFLKSGRFAFKSL
jgi:hypothetical protein